MYIISCSHMNNSPLIIRFQFSSLRVGIKPPPETSDCKLGEFLICLAEPLDSPQTRAKLGDPQTPIARVVGGRKHVGTPSAALAHALSNTPSH